jgi:hypothetical protein
VRCRQAAQAVDRKARRHGRTPLAAARHERLVTQLRAQGQRGRLAHDATKRPENARAELVDKLVRLWGDPPKRTSRRDASQATVAISMGLDGVGTS